MEKTVVFNLIILDESGSMCDCTKATISGCNETINVAKALQKKFADKQNSFISIYAFQSGGDRPSRYICKNIPSQNAVAITDKDYVPCGCTPLLDAIGSTLVDLKAIAQTHEDAMGIVTIITDGYENSSQHYDIAKVRKLISQLKEEGWTFNFIGANIDVDGVANDLNIDNAMAWVNDEKGTNDMFENFSSSMRREAESRIMEENDATIEEKKKMRSIRSKLFFKK